MDKKSIFLALLYVWLGHFLVDFMIGIWPVYKTMMGLDLAKVGMMTAVSVMIGEGLQVVFGSLCDSGYRKHVLIGGILLACFGALYSYFLNYQILFLLLLLVCIGSGAFHPAAASIASTLSHTRKGFFITIFASGGAMGMAASQIIFSTSYLYLDGNTYFLMIPCLLLVTLLLVTHIAGTGKAAKKSPITFKMLQRFFTNRDLITLYILQVANQTVVWAFVFLLPDILSNRGYESWISFGGGHLFLILGSGLMMVPAGYLADKYSPRTVIFISSTCALALVYTFLFLPSLSTPALLSLLFMAGASMGLISPVSIALGNRMLPHNPGLVSASLMGLAWCISEALGQGGGGLLSTLFEDAPAAKAMTILGMFLLVSVGAAAQLPTTVSPTEFDQEGLDIQKK